MFLGYKRLMAATTTVRMVKLSGDLDVEMLPRATKLLRALDDADVAVIDMRSVTYLDSAALGMLMSARQRVFARGGEMRIVSADPRLKRLLTVTGIDKSVMVYEKLQDALDAPR